ncbi:uncharacterized protein B0T23DRAFT_698 [Neurospora hispaniola]|uniref:Secreted peptide n=1 Tax=Neurospora hispaniola TaxID=588809 RepID=A0AAJ0MUZ9_9PEZI|nr:hypothetical protein B0T23DRAFT_698 [Neurospora hispaniola]
MSINPPGQFVTFFFFFFFLAGWASPPSSSTWNIKAWFMVLAFSFSLPNDFFFFLFCHLTSDILCLRKCSTPQPSNRKRATAADLESISFFFSSLPVIFGVSLASIRFLNRFFGTPSLPAHSSVRPSVRSFARSFVTCR